MRTDVIPEEKKRIVKLLGERTILKRKCADLLARLQELDNGGRYTEEEPKPSTSKAAQRCQYISIL